MLIRSNGAQTREGKAVYFEKLEKLLEDYSQDFRSAAMSL